MTLKRAIAVLPLPSVAEHVTIVRPTLKRLPEAGRQETATDPSTSSVAVAWYFTRTRFALRGARTAFDVAPLIVGAVTSNSRRGTTMLPVHVSAPVTLRPGGPATRVSVPLPDAPTYAPVPPVTVNACGDAPGTPSSGMHSGNPATARSRSPFPATLNVAEYVNTFAATVRHSVLSAMKTYVSVTRPSPATTPVPVRAWQITESGTPGGQPVGTETNRTSPAGSASRSPLPHRRPRPARLSSREQPRLRGRTSASRPLHRTTIFY